MAGKLDEKQAKELIDDDGNTLYEVLTKLGFPVQDFDKYQ